MLHVQKPYGNIKLWNTAKWQTRPCSVTCYRRWDVWAACPSQQDHKQVRLAAWCLDRGQGRPVLHAPQQSTEFVSPNCLQSWWLCLISIPHSPTTSNETQSVHSLRYAYVNIYGRKNECTHTIVLYQDVKHAWGSPIKTIMSLYKSWYSQHTHIIIIHAARGCIKMQNTE